MAKNSHPGQSHWSSEQYALQGSAGASRAPAPHLVAHSLTFPRNAEPQELLLTARHPLCSAEHLHSPSEEDMGRSFQVCRPLSIGAPGG